ncbi:MAG TPA: YajG family lipoprotein [Stellaceae bacterium]|nr:YajG family lipoprotein [Stellaceae bacterium]
MKRLLILAFSLSLAACSNSVSSLKYTPSTAIVPVAQSTISGVSAVDRRKEEPTRLATVMGGFGNPLKTLDTASPVSEEVAAAFAEGLRQRGMLAADGHAPFRLVLTVHKMDADMIIGRTARLDFTMDVVNAAGKTVYEDTAVDSVSDEKFFQTGVFADINDLLVMSDTVLSRTIDRMLDKPAFRQAIDGLTGAAS